MHEKKTPLRFDKKTAITLIIVLILLVAAVVLAVIFIGRAAVTKTYAERYQEATALYIDGKYEDAVTALEKAAEARDTEECRILMAKAYREMGDSEKAVRILETWLSNNQGDEAKALLEELKSGGDESPEQLSVGGKKLSTDATAFALSNVKLTAEERDFIGKCVKLNSLSLVSCSVSELGFLSKLTELETLMLSGNSITDAVPLVGLTNLRTLYLDGNAVGDFTPIYALKSLTTLDIRDMDITEKQLAELQDALPGCDIYSDEATVEVEELTLGGVKFKSDVTELDLSGKGISDLAVLKKCRELQTLDVSDNSISDLTPLMELQKLKALDISDNEVSELSPLMSMTGITVLNAANNKITRISALSGFTELTELSLSGNAISSISAIGNMTELRKLGLKSVGLKDEELTSVLAKLTGLRELNIEENPELTGDAVDALIKSLTKCSITHSELTYAVKLGSTTYKTDVTSIDASGTGLTSISELSRCTALVTLVLNNNTITDISPVANLTTIENLEFSGNGLSDIRSLKNHAKLRVLNLMKNGITDISPLSGCYALTELHLSYNSGLADISALSGCSVLATLSLDYTSVGDLTPLSGLINLSYLGLQGCPVTDASALYGLSNLKELYIGGTGLSEQQITDLRAALPNCVIYA